MTRPITPHSHPICPTCQSDLTGREELPYFVGQRHAPPAEDDTGDFYEETRRLICFLGALAEAAPHAAAVHAAELEDTPGWVEYYSWLAEELTKEAIRRLDLLQGAGQIWQSRAKQTTAGKEG